MGTDLRAANGRAHRPTCRRLPANATSPTEEQLAALQPAQCCKPVLPVDLDLPLEARRLLVELRQLREGIDQDTAALDAKYARRTAVFVECRSLDQPVFFDRIGDAAGCTDAAVIQAIRREQRAGG